MRVFRSSYKSRDGRTKKTAKWYIETRDHLQIVRRFVGFVDKRQTEALGRQIQKLIDTRVSGEQPSIELTRWLENIPMKMRDRFVKIGLLDMSRAAAGKPLSEHLEDFKAHLEAKGNTADHVKKTVSRIKRNMKEAGFSNWSDLTANKVQRYLHKRREAGLGAQTFNYYLQAIKQFCIWMVHERRASENPLSHLKAINAEADKRHPRRSLEVAEARALLSAAQEGPAVMGISGYERAMLYRLACESGLRLNELRTLQVSSFDFEGCMVNVQAAYSKRRRYDTLPLKPETARDLKEFLKNKLPQARAFKVPSRGHEAEMLKVDLKAAKIDYVDDAGRYADFHSLRHTTASLLAATGCHPKTAQQILRHSDVNLTLSKYSHVLRGQESAAIANLPDLSGPFQEQQKATGTDNATAHENDSASCLALSRGKQRIKVNGNERKQAGDIDKATHVKQAVECNKTKLQAHRSALPKEGVEPSPCCQDGILNPARLPIPPLRRFLPFTIGAII